MPFQHCCKDNGLSHTAWEIRRELLLGPGGKLSPSHFTTPSVWISGTRHWGSGGWWAQSLLWPAGGQCLPTEELNQFSPGSNWQVSKKHLYLKNKTTLKKHGTQSSVPHDYRITDTLTGKKIFLIETTFFLLSGLSVFTLRKQQSPSLQQQLLDYSAGVIQKKPQKTQTMAYFLAMCFTICKPQKFL